MQLVSWLVRQFSDCSLSPDWSVISQITACLLDLSAISQISFSIGLFLEGIGTRAYNCLGAVWLDMPVLDPAGVLNISFSYSGAAPFFFGQSLVLRD